ncbi:enoyl-[acyl-carrier-protein] reductase [NADH] [Klebsiella quasipneumoniae subsp. quasipneumoniae]|nr:enoyl-[acyl-carrier-protein] reductase [NADH] [Klebsiella quasipneumoniae subsp. quasipneumoniae]
MIGASTGYGLASRISAAFGGGASTIGIFFEKPGTDTKPGSAGWYNSAAFDEAAKREGLYSKSINGDAFSDECRDEVISLIKEDLGQIDLVVYSLASPVRKMPKTGEIVRSALKPIGEVYTSKAIDTNKDQIITASIEPATEEEKSNTVTVMGGEDWELWIDALNNAGVLADGVKTVAYSYIGTDLTWPIYWHGALGKAKEDLDRAAKALRNKLATLNGAANVAVLKSVVTQASSAIPVMPLYISIVFKLMKDRGIHEGCIEQINRLMTTSLYGGSAKLDDEQRIRMDIAYNREDVQQAGFGFEEVNYEADTEQLIDFDVYKEEFLKLFGFGFEEVNYEADTDTNLIKSELLKNNTHLAVRFFSTTSLRIRLFIFSFHNLCFSLRFLFFIVSTRKSYSLSYKYPLSFAYSINAKFGLA